MLPPLKALPVFEAVARLNSFSQAAIELNVSQSAISHQIRQLEDHLGETLFLRQGRHLELTHEGKLYLETISQSLSQIAQATDQIKGTLKTQVRLLVYSSLAVYWLIPRLPNLKRLYPNLDISIEMSHGAPELSDRTGDFFITVENNKRGFTYEPFYQENLFPVCSQAMLENIKNAFHCNSMMELEKILTKSPERLAEFPLITAHSLYDKYAEDWVRWFKNVHVTLPAKSQFHRFSHLALVYEAAKHSLGIALVNDYMMGETDEAQALIRLPCASVKTNAEFFLAYKESRRKETGIQDLKNWLFSEARSLHT
ncbi:LysR family transcriptional regulator [Marinomonas epiphytica]